MDEQTETNETVESSTTSATTVDPKLAMAGQLIDEAVGMLQQAIRLMGQVPGTGSVLSARPPIMTTDDEDARVIEGVFDGQQMIGPDGRHYSVPANYASKSKLIEGDLLKLTITAKGAFVYKQVGPIPRRRLLGELVKSLGSGDFIVRVDGQKYKVLTASVTYFRGSEGDEVTILVPESGQSTWAAVENVMKKSASSGYDHDSTARVSSDDFDEIGVE